jgi:hypothetical protein
MCEILERRIEPTNRPYDQEEPTEKEIIEGLMALSERSLHDFLASEPDIYTDADLKARYR